MALDPRLILAGKGFDIGAASDAGQRFGNLLNQQQSIADNNQLMQQAIRSGDQGLEAGRQNMQLASRRESRTQEGFDAEQQLNRATLINRAAKQFISMSPEEISASFPAVEQSLEQAGIPRGTFKREDITPENLRNTINATEVFMESKTPEKRQIAADIEGRKRFVDTGELTFPGVEREIDPLKQKSSDLREREVVIKEEQLRRGATKLSGALEGALLNAQDSVIASQRNANEFELLANDFASSDITAGQKGSFSEFLKSTFGTQDEISEFKRRFNKVRLSEGLRNLPPGPATDRDIVEAFKGVPKENASSEQVQSFLRGASKLARLQAGYNQFKADFISEKSTAKGLNKEWRSSIFSDVLNKDVSVAEIYQTAQNRGVTPEEVKERLGL